MNVWQSEDKERTILHLDHPRTGSESVRQALSTSPGRFATIGRQHQGRVDEVGSEYRSLFEDAEVICLTTIANPFSMVASWFQYFQNTQESPYSAMTLFELAGYLGTYYRNNYGGSSLYYMLHLADLTLVTEKLDSQWDELRRDYPELSDIGRLNSMPYKRPWLEYFLEDINAIDAMWRHFGQEITIYEGHINRSVLPR